MQNLSLDWERLRRNAFGIELMDEWFAIPTRDDSIAVRQPRPSDWL